MPETDVPTREELVRRASELVPLLRKNAAWAEENRRLHEESIEALSDAGVFKMRVPKRYGGYESDTRAMVDVAAELGRADGSTAWTASVYWIPTWMACQFPDALQDEVFSTPNVRVCGTLSPSAMAKPADGGIVVNGKWGFISGAMHAQWQEIIAILIPKDGDPYPVMALVPMSDVLIVDDWNTTAMKGTGSVSTAARNLFVPQERVLPLSTVVDGRSASVHNADSPIYRPPLLPVACASSVGTVIGLARAAKDAFLDRAATNKAAPIGYAQESSAPLTHLRVGEALSKIDEAHHTAQRLATLVDTKGESGESWKQEERVQARSDLGTVCRLEKDAVDILATASGGSSAHRDLPIHQIVRDIDAANHHALMNPDTNAELYGRLLCGLAPDTAYV